MTKRVISWFMIVVMLFADITAFSATTNTNLSDSSSTINNIPQPSNSSSSSGDARSWGASKAGSVASEEIQSLLGQLGTAKVDLSGGNGFKSGSIDVLAPLFDDKGHVVFTQAGIRRSNQLTEYYRTTANLGFGYRQFFNDDQYMLGANAFYDYDMTRGHRRAGVGVEAWADYLKLSANAYFRLSDWKDSPDVVEYSERPANGWDVRAEGYLPDYAQLGGKVQFEQYYGDEVGLFGYDARQKDPFALTLGVIYSPFPLLNFSLDYKIGKGGERDTVAKAALKYTIGMPLEEQLKSDNIQSSRKLKHNRLALVERNNEIVLEYKKNEAGSIKLPAAVSGNPESVLSFAVAKTGTVSNITWTGTAATFLQGAVGSVGSMLLPSYSSTGNNTYTLSGSGTDKLGRAISSNQMTVTVSPLSMSVSRSKSVALADGTDSVTFTATLLDSTGAAVVNKAVSWSVSNATVVTSTSTTDSNGHATATVVSSNSATATVEVQDSANGTTATSQASFTGDATSAAVSTLTADSTSVVANGTSTSTITALLKDVSGKTVGANVSVTWSTTNGTLSSTTSLTNDAGQATIILTSPRTVGSATVTAKGITTDSGKTVSVQFVADVASAHIVSLSSSSSTSVANGANTVTLTATVQDALSNTVPAGVTVNWSTSTGTLASSTSATNASGVATIVLTAPTTAGTATVTSKGASGDSGKTATITFAADSSTAKVTSFSVAPSIALANGAQIVTLTAIVKDANSNLVGDNVAVHWTTSLGTLANASTNTDGTSTATVSLVSTAAGTASLTAKASASDTGMTGSATFTADASTAKVATIAAGTSSLVANGTSTTSLTATVKDLYGNIVPAGTVVNWTTTLGSLSASTSTTDSAGVATIVLTSGTTAGTATVVAKSASGDSGQSAVITFTGDTSTAHVTAISASSATLSANGATTSTLTATIRDANGNVVGSGATISWTTTSGTLSGATSVTNSSGVATIVLTSATTVGSATVTAKGVSGDSGATASVTFIADTSTAKVSAITSSSSSATANGASIVTLTATLTDAYGNAIGSGISINWTTTLGVLSASSTTTDSTGKATVSLVSTTAGTATVTAKGVAADTGKTASISFTADATTAKVVSVTASPTSIVASGATTSTLTATVQDAYGNVVSSGVSVSWSTTLGTLSASTSTTGTAGTATVVLTSGTTTGTATVTAKGVSTDSGKTAAITFTSAGYTASQFGDALLTCGGFDGTITLCDIQITNNTGSTLTVTGWTTTSNPGYYELDTYVNGTYVTGSTSWPSGTMFSQQVWVNTSAYTTATTTITLSNGQKLYLSGNYSTTMTIN